MKTIDSRGVLVASALLLALSTSALAQNYSITWSSIDGGGSMFTTGGAYKLGSTIGQHDAGPLLSAGGTSVAGGFWFGADVPSVCPADFNHSGAVSVQDIFDYLAAYFANEIAADFNHNGAVTVQDIFDFLAAYFAGCP